MGRDTRRTPVSNQSRFPGTGRYPSYRSSRRCCLGWRDWESVKQPGKFVSELCKSDKGILEFLEGMLARQSRTVGKYAASHGWYVPLEGIQELVDPANPCRTCSTAQRGEFGLPDRTPTDGSRRLFDGDGAGRGVIPTREPSEHPAAAGTTARRATSRHPRSSGGAANLLTRRRFVKVARIESYSVAAIERLAAEMA